MAPQVTPFREKNEAVWYDCVAAVTFIKLSFVCLFGFLTSSSTTRLYRGRAPRQSVWQFYVLPHMRQSWETMSSISAGHIILTPTQPVGSGRPQRGSNPGPPDQESRAVPTELPRTPIKLAPNDRNILSNFFSYYEQESYSIIHMSYMIFFSPFRQTSSHSEHYTYKNNKGRHYSNPQGP